jgi:hypothetical protein
MGSFLLLSVFAVKWLVFYFKGITGHPEGTQNPDYPLKITALKFLFSPYFCASNF